MFNKYIISYNSPKSKFYNYVSDRMKQYQCTKMYTRYRKLIYVPLLFALTNNSNQTEILDRDCIKCYNTQSQSRSQSQSVKVR